MPESITITAPSTLYLIDYIIGKNKNQEDEFQFEGTYILWPDIYMKV